VHAGGVAGDDRRMPVGSTVPPLGYRPAKVAVATAEATAPALILTASRKPAGAGNRAVFAFDGPCCPGKGLVIRIYTDSEINGNEWLEQLSVAGRKSVAGGFGE